MTQEIPGVPITAVPATGAPNADLPSDPFASLTRITLPEYVGPPVANRQEQALEKRDETLRAAVNLLVAAMNALDAIYLRKDGTTQQDSTAGLAGNVPANGHVLTGLGNGSSSGDSVNYGQFASAIALLAPLISPAFTGTPTRSTTPSLSDSSGQLANTAFVQGVIAAGTYTAIEHTYGGSAIPSNNDPGYTYTAARDVVVMLTAVGGGAGGSSDGDVTQGCGGGGGGGVINLPIPLAAGDTIAITVGNGGQGGRPGTGAAGNATIITITKAAWPVLGGSGSGTMVITCGGGAGPTGSGTPGAGGSVTYQLLNSSPLTTTTPAYPGGLTGAAGGRGGSTAHTFCQGGASPLAPGGFGTGLTNPLTSGFQGSGGGGGDAGSDGGAGYAILTIVNRP